MFGGHYWASIVCVLYERMLEILQCLIGAPVFLNSVLDERSYIESSLNERLFQYWILNERLSYPLCSVRASMSSVLCCCRPVREGCTTLRAQRSNRLREPQGGDRQHGSRSAA